MPGTGGPTSPLILVPGAVPLNTPLTLSLNHPNKHRTDIVMPRLQQDGIQGWTQPG